MLLQAHRGVSSEYPENTFAAFKAAAEQGYPIIELDPAVTLDGRIVILHDRTINRTARTQAGDPIEKETRISDITLEEAMQYDFGIYYGESFRGERLPLLSDVLSFAKEKGIHIKIDNKVQAFTPPQLEELFRILEESGADYGITSNDPTFVEKVCRRLRGCAIHYDGRVTEEILIKLKSTVTGRLAVWLPIKNKLTDWFEGDFADAERAALVKKYALLGIWILSEQSDYRTARDEYKADIVETTGTIKPEKENRLQAGFARTNITPMLGIGLPGYYYDRFADGVLDELEINAMALSCGDMRCVLLTVDNEGLSHVECDDFRAAVTDATGLPRQNIYIHVTHSHTSGFIRKDAKDPLEKEYYALVRRRIADAAAMALSDLKPAVLGYGIGTAPNIAFVRRYRMKDGTVRTNPGIGNPDIVCPLGKADERVCVVRFKRENAPDIVAVSFAMHPDNIGGCKISADWPGFTRRKGEKLFDDTRFIVFNGAEGDINSLNVHPTGGYLNDMIFFDDGPRAYSHAEHIGNTVLGAVLQTFNKLKYVDTGEIKCGSRKLTVPSNMPEKSQLAEAHRICGLHAAGKDAELGLGGMMLTTVVAEAIRMVELENGPESFEMELSGIAVGKVAFVGIPGEPFAGVGFELKKAEGWDMVVPTCITNGKYGYFPMMDAFKEGGYEARSSIFKAGVAERIVEAGQKLLEEMR